jgi:aromatic ring-opening dioxygenase LigB subunit
MAKQFDELMEKWAEKLDSKLLINKAAPMLSKALCCGYIGFVILQGMIENKNFTPKVISRIAPTYYGMMVASYTRKENE